MTAATLIAALALPPDSRVDQRVPKKLLVENGAPTAADKRQINEGIEELLWLAALKPSTIGVPAFSDDIREYLEIAVLSLTLRPGAKAPRLTELIHRAIPYPVFLIQSEPAGLMLSLAHLRWSQGQIGQTVLDGAPVTVTVEPEAPTTTDFLASLNVSSHFGKRRCKFYFVSDRPCLKETGLGAPIPRTHFAATDQPAGNEVRSKPSWTPPFATGPRQIEMGALAQLEDAVAKAALEWLARWEPKSLESKVVTLEQSCDEEWSTLRQFLPVDNTPRINPDLT